MAWRCGSGTYIPESAELHDLDLDQNVYVMADVEPENVSVTDTVIFLTTTLRDTDIARSIVDRDAQIVECPLDSVLGSAHLTLTNATILVD